jgi:hypothetical protein
MSPFPPLLGPDFETLDCARFLLHVTSLKRIPVRSSKPLVKMKLTGRWLEKPTRVRFGNYQVEYNGILLDVPAPKDMTVTPEQIDEMCVKLLCPKEPLEAFLKSKRFVIRVLETKLV